MTDSSKICCEKGRAGELELAQGSAWKNAQTLNVWVLVSGSYKTKKLLIISLLSNSRYKNIYLPVPDIFLDLSDIFSK
jgi:hypothetical protein